VTADADEANRSQRGVTHDRVTPTRVVRSVEEYVERVAPVYRQRFERIQELILTAHPKAQLRSSENVPTSRVGTRRLDLGVWKHGVSRGGMAAEAGRGFRARHPSLLSVTSTIPIRPHDAEEISEIGVLVGGAPEPYVGRTVEPRISPALLRRVSRAL
jgi:hypothetical protein